MPHVPDTRPVNTPAPLIVLPAQQLQTPPEGVLDRVVLLPWQTVSVPEMAPGAAFTVTTADEEHPPDQRHIIVAVPGATPATIPDGVTVATDGDEELQDTPGVAQLSVVVCPSHSTSVPVTGAGLALTVSTAVARHPDGNV